MKANLIKGNDGTLTVSGINHPGRRAAMVFTHATLGDDFFVPAIREAMIEYFEWLDGGVPFSHGKNLHRSDTDDFMAANGVLIQIIPLTNHQDMFSFDVAMKALKDGKRVRHHKWSHYQYVYYVEGNAQRPPRLELIKSRGLPPATWEPNANELASSGWMIAD